MTLLADIGNGTMNLMYLNNGRPMESKAWTEKLGVFQCFQKIHNMVQDKTGDNLMDDVIDNILRSGKMNCRSHMHHSWKRQFVTMWRRFFRSFVTMNIMRS